MVFVSLVISFYTLGHTFRQNTQVRMHFDFVYMHHFIELAHLPQFHWQEDPHPMDVL